MTGLAERKAQAAIEHLVQAAREGMVLRGLDITVEEIARLAGVGRRTVFRYVTAREELLVAALRSTLSAFDDELPQLDDEDWRAWLSRLCSSLHQMNSRFGLPVWELLTRSNLPPALDALARELDQHRRARNLVIADELWQAAGLDGPAPDSFRAAVLTHLGPLFTMSVARDAGGGHEVAGALAESALSALVDGAVLHRGGDRPS